MFICSGFVFNLKPGDKFFFGGGGFLIFHKTFFFAVKISNFNRAKPRPDIIEEEKMYAYPSHITSEVGFR